MNAKIEGAEAVVRSLRSSEHAAALTLEKYLADDVVLEANGPMRLVLEAAAARRVVRG